MHVITLKFNLCLSDENHSSEVNAFSGLYAECYSLLAVWFSVVWLAQEVQSESLLNSSVSSMGKEVTQG